MPTHDGENEFDPWATDSGLYSNYDGTVVDAWFAYNERSGNYDLNLKFLTEDEEHPEVEEKYGCGADWKSVDNGDTVEKNGVSRGKFNMNSGYGKLIDRVRDLVKDELREWGSPTQAFIWVGTKWHMVPIDSSFTNRQTNEQVKMFKNYPSHYYGRGETTPGGSPGTLAPIAPELIEKLAMAAKNAPSYAEWVNEVFTLPEVVSDDRVVREIADENGLWATLKNES